MKSKICSKCKKEKLFSEFHKDRTKKGGITSYCAECSCKEHKVYYGKNKHKLLANRKIDRKNDPKKYQKFNKRHYIKHREYYLWAALKKQYGITKEDYNVMFGTQQGCCAICGVHQVELKRKLDVDHNHLTGKIRGLLCNKCNLGLGAFDVDKKNISLLQKVIEYLGDRK